MLGGMIVAPGSGVKGCVRGGELEPGGSREGAGREPGGFVGRGRSPHGRMNSRQQRHEVRLRGLSVTGGCHATGTRPRRPDGEHRAGCGSRLCRWARIGPERMNSPLEIREVRLRGLVRRGRVPRAPAALRTTVAVAVQAGEASRSLRGFPQSLRRLQPLRLGRRPPAPHPVRSLHPLPRSLWERVAEYSTPGEGPYPCSCFTSRS